MPTAAQRVGDVVEELDRVLDDDREVLRLLAGPRGDRGQRVEDLDRQRLRATLALDDAVLDPGAALELEAVHRGRGFDAVDRDARLLGHLREDAARLR